MNPEEEILALEKENNTILKKLLRAQIIQNWMKAGYIFIMIAFVYGGYVFLKPMLSNLLGTYQSVFNLSGHVQDGAQIDTSSINVEKFNELVKTLK